MQDYISQAVSCLQSFHRRSRKPGFDPRSVRLGLVDKMVLGHVCLPSVLMACLGTTFVRAVCAVANIANIRFVMSVRLSTLSSVRMFQRGSYWTDFRDIRYWLLLRKPFEEVQIWLKLDKTMAQFTWRPKYVLLQLATEICYKSIIVQQ